MPIPILDGNIPVSQYCEIDLSVTNKELQHVDLTDPVSCQAYVDRVLKQNDAQVAYGGYLEQRNLYADKPSFTTAGGARNIHLGVDFWAPAGTAVMAPLEGVVHSFRNNNTKGDYGPTIILQHQSDTTPFYTLYGHLSLESLEDLSIGKSFKAGSRLGSLGTPDINVNYAPHLHFQLIWNIDTYQGDYPGVCSAEELDYFKRNCPDPCILLGI